MASYGAMFWFTRNRLSGIEAALHLAEPRVVRAVGRRHAVGLVLGHEVDVDPAVACGATPRRTPAPSAMQAVVRRRRPPSARGRSSRSARRGGVGRGVGRRRAQRRRRLGDEDLALRRRQPRGVDRRALRSAPSLELGEVVRLPVVARAGREQRIEGLLPAACTAHGPTCSPTAAPNCRSGVDRPLASLGIAGIDDGKHHDVLAVHLGGQERQRRRLAQHRPDVELVGRAATKSRYARRTLRPASNG